MKEEKKKKEEKKQVEEGDSNGLCQEHEYIMASQLQLLANSFDSQTKGGGIFLWREASLAIPTRPIIITL